MVPMSPALAALTKLLVQRRSALHRDGGVEGWATILLMSRRASPID